MITPGPFIAPGVSPAALDLWQPDFYNVVAPPLPPGYTDIYSDLYGMEPLDGTAADFSSLSPPGLFISPGNNGIWLLDFILGAPPAPLGVPDVYIDVYIDLYGGQAPGPVADPTAFDGSSLVPPGPFIGPGSLVPDIPLPDFSAGAPPQPLAPVVTVINAWDPGIPPGLFISPGGFFFPAALTGQVTAAPAPAAATTGSFMCFFA